MAILNWANWVQAIEPYEGSVALNKSSITLKEVWETFQLVATTDPVSLANKWLTWTSSDTSIATVSSTWLVSCVSPWECVITVMTNTKRYTATCNVSEWRTPWSNTVLYLPMSDDLLDHSWNNISITANNVSLRGTDRPINAWYFWWWDNACLSFTNTSNMSWSWTISTWFKTASNANQWFLTQWTESSNKWLHLGYWETSRWMLMGFYSNDMDSNSTNWTDNNRHLATFTYNWWWESKIYLDWELIKSWALSWLNTWNNTWYIGRYLSWTSKFNWYMSERIMEKVVWTAEEIKDYYNITKWTYKWTIEDFDILEYIQSSWSQVIKTWVYITETWIRADIDFQITSSASSDQAMIWFYSNENSSHNYRCWYWANDWFTLSSWVSSLDRQTGTWNSISFTESSYQIYLFAKQRYSDWRYDSNATWKLYSCQIYKWNTLVRDFIPVKRKSDWVIWVWDNVNWDFYTNQWSWTFTAWPKLWVSISPSSVSLTTAWQTEILTATPNPSSVWAQWYTWSSSDTSIATVTPMSIRLPNTYQEVEYIQSSWTQYIITSIIPSDTKGIYMKVSSQNVTNDLMYIGSNDNSSDSWSKKFWLWNSSSKLYFWFNDWLPTSWNRPATTANTIVELENNFKNSRLMKKDWTTVYTITNTLTSNGYWLNIFAHNWWWTVQYNSSIKLYSLKISDWSNIVNDFVPCYRKSDSVIWLYDLVNNQFYTNAGSWTFTKWPDISTAIVTCVTPWTCTITCTAVATGDTATCDVVTVEEYVLLSEWWSINKFSELSQATNNTSPAIRNNTTNRIWQALQTDKNTPMYKTFTKEIVWFDMIFQLTETYAYEWMEFILQSSTWTARDDSQAFHINTENDSYSWRYWVTIWVDNSQIHNTWSTTRNSVRVQWSKSWTTWTITVSWWASFTKTFTTSNVYKAVHFTSRRRYTSSNIWNFQKVVLYLK